MKKPFLQSLAIVVAIALAILARYFYPKAEFPQTELPTVSDQVEVEKLNSKSLSTCISDLKDIEAIKIDEAVKNCIHKEKIGQQPDGLGGLFSIIGIYNNTLVEIENEFYADVENAICMGTEINRQNPEEEIILYAAPAPEHYLEMYYDATTPDGEKNPLNQLNPIRAVIGKGLINEIPFLYPKSIYCNSGDEDCGFMTLFARSDGENYFIPGYRNINKLYRWRENDDPLYFVINDILYEAGDREFAGINDGNIIVKRITNLVEDLEKREKSTFTLETCEIDI